MTGDAGTRSLGSAETAPSFTIPGRDPGCVVTLHMTRQIGYFGTAVTRESHREHITLGHRDEVLSNNHQPTRPNHLIKLPASIMLLSVSLDHCLLYSICV